MHGAFLGAIFLISMPQVIALAKDYLPPVDRPGARACRALVYGAVLIAFVLFEPLGLYGRWLKMRTYLQLFPFYRKGLFKRQKSVPEVGPPEMSANDTPCSPPRTSACASAACWPSTT